MVISSLQWQCASRGMSEKGAGLQTARGPEVCLGPLTFPEFIHGFQLNHLVSTPDRGCFFVGLFCFKWLLHFLTGFFQTSSPWRLLAGCSWDMAICGSHWG